MYREHLPQYQHIVKANNWARLWREIKSGEKICALGAFKTEEREAFALFSHAGVYELPPEIILLESTWVAMGQPKAVSFKTLIQEGKYTGAIEKGRSYSDQIDEILQVYSDSPAIGAYSTTTDYLGMLHLKRIDYFVEFPTIVAYKAVEAGYAKEAFKSVKISEFGLGDLGYVVCGHGKNGWGIQVISDINAMLEKSKPEEEYREIMKEWRMKSADQQAYQAFYDEIFLHQ